MWTHWEIYGLQPGSLSFSGAKLSSSIIKTSEESFWSQQWAVRQTLMQTRILYTNTHIGVMHTLAIYLCSHTRQRYTFGHTHICYISMYLHSGKIGGQIWLEIYLLSRRTFIWTARWRYIHTRQLLLWHIIWHRPACHHKGNVFITRRQSCKKKKKKQSRVLTMCGAKLCINSNLNECLQ